ncbi:MAG TPA: hypothetical protein PLX89_25865 [Verrucomicrobiota bacterium]|nr:hypothetical protein [Verrucomicrobiales bacterium]HRI16435.1 hypothetical protein [Verrucomicrobiota bacterium]
MNAEELQFQLQKSVLIGACVITAIFFGLLLAGAPFLLILVLFGVVWLMTLPYHATIAVYLIIATVNSALILPSVPGRPFFWELGVALGWSGLIVSLALRRQTPGTGQRIQQNWALLAAMVGYCCVLLFLIYYRGVGIRSLSGDSGGQMGGRLYLQQLAITVLPLLLIVNPLSERILVRLFVVQCFLSITYIVSDFIFTQGRGSLFNLLLFLELPTDGANFESQSLNFGIRRFQSLFIFALGMLSILWLKRPLRDYANRNAFWMWPLTLGFLAIGLLSGHRHLLYISSVMLLINAWAQRFFSVPRLAAMVVVGLVFYAGSFAYVRSLPLAAQRALSFVPGIEVDRLAYEDGFATMEGRRALRRVGLEVAKQYVWVGRGFGKSMNIDPSLYRYDLTYMNIDNGIFYNGTIGLLVNTGVPGTICMFVFLGAGSFLAWRILQLIRQMGAEDDFSRLSSLVASFWFALVISFVFLHGDAEYALRSFGLPAGILIACRWHLERRLAAQQTVASEPVQAISPPPEHAFGRLRPAL